MVNRGRGYRSPFTQTGLAKVLITIKDALTNEGPLATVATFVAALALLVVLPSCITVLIAIAAAVSSGIAAAMLTAARGIALGTLAHAPMYQPTRTTLSLDRVINELSHILA